MNKSFLKKLMATISPSGYEEEVAHVWLAEAKKITKDVWCDAMGSSHAVINPKAKRKIVLMGHYDEIGLIINSIDKDGFIRIDSVGGWDSQVLVGQRVVIRGGGAKKNVYGVIGKTPIHLLGPDERNKATKIKDLFVDIGARSKKEAEKLVAIGDAMVLNQEFLDLENDNFTSRACDDKVGAFIVLEVLKELAKRKLDVCVEAVATSQEEVGTRGAIAAAYASNAEIGIAVDVTFAFDFPGADTKMGDIKIGGGAVLTRGCNVHPKLFSLLKNTAMDKKISYQTVAAGSPTGTDGRSIQVSRNGIITAVVSIPNRYMHSPSEVCNYKDVQAIIDLLVETISGITPKTDFDFISKRA